MFLIDAIKPNVEKILKTCFLSNCLDKESRERTKLNRFVSFCVRFVSDNKNINQKEIREIILLKIILHNTNHKF